MKDTHVDNVDQRAMTKKSMTNKIKLKVDRLNVCTYKLHKSHLILPRNFSTTPIFYHHLKVKVNKKSKLIRLR